MLSIVVLALVGRLVLPDSAGAVAALAIVILGAVFIGVSQVLRSRQLREALQRNLEDVAKEH